MLRFCLKYWRKIESFFANIIIFKPPCFLKLEHHWLLIPASIGTHLFNKVIESALHDLAFCDVLAGYRYHAVQHLFPVCYPLLHNIHFGEELVEGEGVQQALLPNLGHLHQLLVPMRKVKNFNIVASNIVKTQKYKIVDDMII